MPCLSAPAAVRRITKTFGWLLILGMALSPLRAAEHRDKSSALFSEDGYRVADFRAPVPQKVAGAVTVDTTQTSALFDSGEVLFIDVLPAPERPQGLAPHALWMPLARHNIPGSVWLPNVGYGRLSDTLTAFYQSNLKRLTQGNHDKPMVIYCLADCWMSWNAARRAAADGYTHVYWYPDGTDGWQAAGLPLEKSEPLALPKH